MAAMKRLIPFLVLCAAASAAVAADGAKSAPTSRAVLAPVKRVDALKLTERVLVSRAPTWKTTNGELQDPFFRVNFAPQEEKPVEPEPAPPSARSDIEVLQVAADTHINPTGIMMVDGEYYMLLNGKRHKTGAQLPITMDGIVYTITISAIEGKSYSLRLNEHELRRQLK
jgi:hypothetical protein